MILATIAAIGITLTIPPKQVQQHVDRAKFLEAIRQVENWDGLSAGRAGEWGPFQMTPGEWQQFTKSTSIYKATPAQLRAAANWAIGSYTLILDVHRVPITPYWLAFAWNSGASGAAKAYRTKHASSEQCDYAQRVENIYNSL